MVQLCLRSPGFAGEFPKSAINDLIASLPCLRYQENSLRSSLSGMDKARLLVILNLLLITCQFVIGAAIYGALESHLKFSE